MRINLNVPFFFNDVRFLTIGTFVRRDQVWFGGAAMFINYQT